MYKPILQVMPWTNSFLSQLISCLPNILISNHSCGQIMRSPQEHDNRLQLSFIRFMDSSSYWNGLTGLLTSRSNKFLKTAKFYPMDGDVLIALYCQTNQQIYLTVFKLFYDFSWKYPNQSYLLISQTINADYFSLDSLDSNRNHVDQCSQPKSEAATQFLLPDHASTVDRFLFCVRNLMKHEDRQPVTTKSSNITHVTLLERGNRAQSVCNSTLWLVVITYTSGCLHLIYCCFGGDLLWLCVGI